MVVHAAAADMAAELVNGLREQLGEIEIPVLPAAPVLGAHAGPGTVAVGINWRDE